MWIETEHLQWRVIMKVIGISGSPIPNSNVDRAVKKVLEATGMDTEFIKLSNYKFEACRTGAKSK